MRSALMATPENGAGEPLELTLSTAVDAALDRVITETTAGSEGARKSYGDLKAPILNKLLTMENDQSFEITFNSPDVANAFAAGFNETAPRNREYIYGAVADDSVLSLKRMAPVGFIIKDGKEVPI
jgi:hypothetical protein